MFSGKGYRRYKGGVAHDRVQKHTQKRQVQSRNGYKNLFLKRAAALKVVLPAVLMVRGDEAYHA